jgi:hypothetical protein
MSSGRETLAGQGKKGDEEKRTEPGATGESAGNRSHESKRAREEQEKE